MFKELMLESSRDTYLEYFKENKSAFLMKRIILAVLFGLIGIAITIILKMPILILVALILAGFGFKMPYMQLLSRKSNADMLKTFMFPQFLRYFIALYSTQGNVYKTLIETSKYLDDPLKSRLEQFIKEIGEENAYEKYVDFAEYIGTTDAQLVMSMIYSFSEQGAVKEELDELERASKKINENKMIETINYKTKKQEVYMNYAVLLSVGYLLAFVAVIIVAKVVQIMGIMGTIGSI